MRRPWFLIALTVVSLVPFIVNAFGHGIFLYLNFGSRDAIFAASQGVSHNAIAEHFPVDPAFKSYNTTLIHAGPLHLFTEQPDEFRPYRFDVMTSTDYFGVEVPSLLITVILGMLAAWRWRRGSNQRLQLTGDARAG